MFGRNIQKCPPTFFIVEDRGEAEKRQYAMKEFKVDNKTAHDEQQAGHGQAGQGVDKVEKACPAQWSLTRV